MAERLLIDAPKSRRRWWRPDVRAWPVAQKYLVVLLVLFIAKQVFNVIVFPPFTGHDEVVHYAYVRMVADEHRVPIIPDLDEWRAAWQQRETDTFDVLPTDLYRYCDFALDWNYCQEPEWEDNPPLAVTYERETYPHGWQYAGNHPPLFYLIQVPVYKVTERLTPGVQQYFMRALAIPIGVAVVILTFLMANLLFPRDRFISLVAPTFVAFQTQVSYEGAMINNDILLVGLFTLVSYLLIRGVRNGFTIGSAAVVGLALGLGLLAKATMLTAAPLVAFAIICGVGVRAVRDWVTLGAITAVVAGLVSWPWYVFLHQTYGNFSALPQVKELQFLRTYRDSGAPSIWDQLIDKGFAQLRWRETWGEFGWRRIHLESWLLIGIGIPLLIMTVAALVTLIGGSIQRLRRNPDGVHLLSREQVQGLWLLVAVAVIAYGAMLQFGTSFSLTQARYYFNAVGALAILIAFGLKSLTPPKMQNAVAVTFLLFMVAANVLIYSQAVLPYWYLST